MYHMQVCREIVDLKEKLATPYKPKDEKERSVMVQIKSAIVHRLFIKTAILYVGCEGEVNTQSITCASEIYIIIHIIKTSSTIKISNSRYVYTNILLGIFSSFTFVY